MTDWVPLRYLTSSLGRGTAPTYVDDGPVRMVNQAANQPGGIDWERTKFHEFSGNADCLKGKLQRGDVIVNSTGTGTLGRVGWFEECPDSRPCVADGHVTKVRFDPHRMDRRFGFYYLSSESFKEFMFEALISGSTNQIELNGERMRSTRVPVPPLEEQRRIADFLDAETSRIDSIVSIRSQQMELIDQRAYAREYRAIKGGNEIGPKKNSRLRWLGEVPDTWPIAKVSSQFAVQLGKMLNQERSSSGRLRPYLRNINVQWNRIDTADLLQMDFPLSERTRYGLRDGDLLICEGGEPGRSAIWDGSIEDVYYQKALHRARSRGRSKPKWLYYCMRAASALNVFAVEGNVSTISHLTGEQLLGHRFPFPSPETQERLIDELESATEEDCALLTKLRRQLKLLAERRQALITNAVTGQLDVATATEAINGDPKSR